MLVCVSVSMYFLCVCVFVIWVETRTRPGATCTRLDTNCTARHLSFICPFIFVMFFFPVILVYRYYYNAAGFGWVGDFILLTRLHTVCIIYFIHWWYRYLYWLLYICIMGTYYTILLFLLGRIDIGILQLIAMYIPPNTIYLFYYIDPWSR